LVERSKSAWHKDASRRTPDNSQEIEDARLIRRGKRKRLIVEFGIELGDAIPITAQRAKVGHGIERHGSQLLQPTDALAFAASNRVSRPSCGRTYGSGHLT